MNRGAAGHARKMREGQNEWEHYLETEAYPTLHNAMNIMIGACRFGRFCEAEEKKLDMHVELMICMISRFVRLQAKVYKELSEPDEAQDDILSQFAYEKEAPGTWKQALVRDNRTTKTKGGSHGQKDTAQNQFQD